MHTHHVIVSMGQESRHCFSGSTAQVSPRFQSERSPGLGSHLRLRWKKIHFPVHAMVGRIQFPESCEFESLASLLAVSQRSCAVSCHIGFSVRWLALSKKMRSIQRVSRQGGSYNLSGFVVTDICKTQEGLT